MTPQGSPVYYLLAMYRLQSLKRAVAVGLVVSLLLLTGAVYAQTVEHAVHHAHHQAATHATILCSWMCAAGQVLEGVEIILQEAIQPLAFLPLPAVAEPSIADRPSILSRGPPVSL